MDRYPLPPRILVVVSRRLNNVIPNPSRTHLGTLLCFVSVSQVYHSTTLLASTSTSSLIASQSRFQVVEYQKVERPSPPPTIMSHLHPLALSSLLNPSSPSRSLAPLHSHSTTDLNGARVKVALDNVRLSLKEVELGMAVMEGESKNVKAEVRGLGGVVSAMGKEVQSSGASRSSLLRCSGLMSIQWREFEWR